MHKAWTLPFVEFKIGHLYGVVVNIWQGLGLRKAPKEMRRDELLDYVL
jgi:hypothetical protein